MTWPWPRRNYCRWPLLKKEIRRDQELVHEKKEKGSMHREKDGSEELDEKNYPPCKKSMYRKNWISGSGERIKSLPGRRSKK